jgi:magnesium-transporting ATPase (P-type)
MEFNSDRKRMSILFRDPNDGKIKLFMKGADSIMLERVDEEQYSNKVKKKVDWFVDQSSKQGLRTLLMGMKVVDEKEN